MELPDHHFPANPCPYTMSKTKGSNFKRLTFAEYGAYQNVDICSQGEGGDLEFRPQKGQQSTAGLSTALPTIPLTKEPLDGPWVARDRILGLSNFKDTISKMKSVILSEPMLRKAIKNNPTYSRNLRQCHRALLNVEKRKNFSDIISILHEKLPASIQTFHEKLEDIGQAYNSDCWLGYNRDFYGGLLAHTTTDDPSTQILFHARGEVFNEICVSRVVTDPETGLKSLYMESSVPGPTMFQICTSSISGSNDLVCARESDGCRVFSLDADTHLLQEKNRADLEGPISSTCFNPYMRNEVLMSSPKDYVHLWDIECGVSHLRYGRSSRSSHNSELWSTAFFGGHPRHIIVANKTSVLQFDHRTNFSKSVSLFTLSGSFTKPEEQIMAACSAGFPYHSVATDYGLFILDNRFPGTPVLKWSTELLSQPQYLQSLEAEKEAGSYRKLLFLASQQPAEVMCFPMDIARAQPPTAPISPWRVSRIEEFSSIFSVTDSTVKKRFENSLAGLTVSHQRSDDSFTVYQLDSCGDIFYQRFVPEISDDLSDTDDPLSTRKGQLFQCFKACTATEMAAAKARVEKWLAVLEAQSPAALPETPALDLKKKDDDPQLLNVDPNLVMDIFDCSLTPTEILEQEQITMQQVEQSESRNVDPLWPHRNLKSFTCLPLKRGQTKLLLALKDGRDIDEILRKREQEHFHKKLEKRREFKRQKRLSRPPRKRRREQSSESSNSGESSEPREATPTPDPPDMSVLEAIINRPLVQTPDQQASTMDSNSAENTSVSKSKCLDATKENTLSNSEVETGKKGRKHKTRAKVEDDNHSSLLSSGHVNLTTTKEQTAEILPSSYDLPKAAARKDKKLGATKHFSKEDQNSLLNSHNLNQNSTTEQTLENLPSTSSNLPQADASLLSSSSSSISSSSSSASSISSASSSSSSLTASGENAGEKANECRDPVEDGQEQRNVSHHENIIAWLLHSNSIREKSLESQEDKLRHSLSSKTSAGHTQLSPSIENIGLSPLDKTVRTTDVIDETYDSDVESECCSQRSYTLARPDLRKVVDPSLSGFLSSPQGLKDKRNLQKR